MVIPIVAIFCAIFLEAQGVPVPTGISSFTYVHQPAVHYSSWISHQPFVRLNPFQSNFFPHAQVLPLGFHQPQVLLLQPLQVVQQPSTIVQAQKPNSTETPPAPVEPVKPEPVSPDYPESIRQEVSEAPAIDAEITPEAPLPPMKNDDLDLEGLEMSGDKGEVEGNKQQDDTVEVEGNEKQDDTVAVEAVAYQATENDDPETE